MVYLKDENLEELINDDKVIVDFYADWCGPCKMLGAVLEQIAKEHQDIKIIKINVDDHQDLAIKYGVMSIPRVLVFKSNNQINDITGFTSKEDILKGLS